MICLRIDKKLTVKILNLTLFNKKQKYTQKQINTKLIIK
jgi:hypothetical protein